MLAPDPRNPLIVQSDHSILVEVDNPRYAGARALRVVSLQGLSPAGCPCLFVFLFYGLFCSAFGFCCALTGSLSFGVGARCPLKATPTGCLHGHSREPVSIED
jgi:hypothetical protein